MFTQDSRGDGTMNRKGTSFNDVDVNDSDEDDTWKGTLNIWEE